MSCCVVGDFLVNTGLFHPLFENLIGGRTGRKFRENKRIVIFIRFPLRQPLDGILRERCINGSGCLLLTVAIIYLPSLHIMSFQRVFPYHSGEVRNNTKTDTPASPSCYDIR